MSGVNEKGFVLMIVVVAITLTAAIAMAMGLSGANDTRTSVGEFERSELRYVVEAGMAHAKHSLSANGTCTAYADIPSTSFGNDSYSATVSPVDGSPVSISVSGQLQNGVTLIQTAASVPVYLENGVQTFQPNSSGIDTYIRDGANDGNNFGASAILKINNASAEEATLLEFDLSSIPADSEIFSATLSLWLEGGESINSGVLDLHRMTQSWVEGDKDGQAPPAGAGATYQSYNGQSNWATEGGDYSSVVEDNVSVNSLTPAWYQWDTTSLVQDWVSGAATNDGLIIRASAGTVQKIYFTSGDGAASQRPKLAVNYACECSVDCTYIAPGITPFAHWTLDDGSGGTAVDSAGGNDATLMNGPGWVDGRDAGALELNGSNHYGVVPDSDVLPLVGTFTAAAWVNNYSPDGFEVHRIVSNEASGTNSNFWMALQGPDLFVGVGGEFFTPPNTFATNTWYHVAVTFDDASNTLRIYVDGTLALEETSLATPTPSAAPFYIGTNWEGSKYWEGMIDDVRLYDVVLDASDIEQIVQEANEGGRLLFVASNDSKLSNEEKEFLSLFELWGYDVQLIDDDDSQATFDKAVVDNEVVFASAKISDTKLGSKLLDAPIGFVFSEAALLDEYGLAAGFVEEKSSSLIVGEAHYVTSPFATGSLAISAETQAVAYLDSAASPGIIEIANSNGGLALAALEAGAEMYGGGSVIGRRAFFPLSESSFNPGNLNADGQMLLRRTLEWGRGAGPVAGPSGLLAHWKLDDGVGISATDSAGDHDGELEEGPTWVSGTVDGGLDFDGGNDYVEVPHSSDLVLLDKMTFTAWINSSRFRVRYQTIISRDIGASGSNFWFGTYAGDVVFGLWANSVFEEVFVTSATLDVDTWYHVAASFDATADLVRLYVDGSQIHEASFSYNPDPTAAPVLIGASPDGENWEGVLDDIRIYNTVLDAGAVLDLAATGGSGSGGGGDGGGGSGSSCDGTFRDEFNARSYSSNDGTLTWTGDWQEVGESDGASRGDIQVRSDLGNYELRTRDNDNGGEGVQREADLSGASKAMLAYAYSRVSLDNSDDYSSVQISANGSAGPWVELARYQGPGTDSSYISASHDISRYAASDTTIRFITSSSMGGTDTVWFDNIEIACGP